jgi:hypothetical protein
VTVRLAVGVLVATMLEACRLPAREAALLDPERTLAEGAVRGSAL